MDRGHLGADEVGDRRGGEVLIEPVAVALAQGLALDGPFPGPVVDVQLDPQPLPGPQDHVVLADRLVPALGEVGSGRGQIQGQLGPDTLRGLQGQVQLVVVVEDAQVVRSEVVDDLVAAPAQVPAQLERDDQLPVLTHGLSGAHVQGQAAVGQQRQDLGVGVALVLVDQRVPVPALVRLRLQVPVETALAVAGPGLDGLEEAQVSGGLGEVEGALRAEDRRGPLQQVAGVVGPDHAPVRLQGEHAPPVGGPRHRGVHHAVAVDGQALDRATAAVLFRVEGLVPRRGAGGRVQRVELAALGIGHGQRVGHVARPRVHAGGHAVLLPQRQGVGHDGPVPVQIDVLVPHQLRVVAQVTQGERHGGTAAQGPLGPGRVQGAVAAHGQGGGPDRGIPPLPFVHRQVGPAQALVAGGGPGGGVEGVDRAGDVHVPVAHARAPARGQVEGGAVRRQGGGSQEDIVRRRPFRRVPPQELPAGRQGVQGVGLVLAGAHRGHVDRAVRPHGRALHHLATAHRVRRVLGVEGGEDPQLLPRVRVEGVDLAVPPAHVEHRLVLAQGGRALHGAVVVVRRAAVGALDRIAAAVVLVAVRHQVTGIGLGPGRGQLRVEGVHLAVVLVPLGAVFGPVVPQHAPGPEVDRARVRHRGRDVDRHPLGHRIGGHIGCVPGAEDVALAGIAAVAPLGGPAASGRGRGDGEPHGQGDGGSQRFSVHGEGS